MDGLPRLPCTANVRILISRNYISTCKYYIDLSCTQGSNSRAAQPMPSQHYYMTIAQFIRWDVVKKQPSQDVLQGDTAEEELGLARLVSSYTLPHQNSQPGGRGQQTAHSKMLSRCARDT